MKYALFRTAPTVAPPPSAAPSPSINWDAAGVIGSMVCLLHCLLLPVAMVVLPWLVLVQGEWLHRVLAVTLMAPALLAFSFGWRHHGRWLPGFLMAVGLLALNAAAFLAPEQWETALTVLGGVFLVVAHGLNRHLSRRCGGRAGCLP